MAVTTRTGLIDYCLRRLGAPVIEINVDPDQVDDRIDDALQFYQEYHSDATLRVYLKHQVTQTDIDNRYIPIDDSILYVKRLFPLTEENSSVNMFDAEYQLHLNDIFDLGGMGNLANYEMIQQYMSMLDLKLNGASEFTRYNRHQNRLYIDADWERDITIGEYFIVEAMQIVAPTEFSDVYNDMFLKQYATALIKQQWGANLIKFEGMQLPGGVQFSGRQLFDDATQEIQTIREQMQLNYEMPTDFFVG